MFGWGSAGSVPGACHADGLVGADRVVGGPVVVDVVGEGDAVADVVTVEPLVFDRSEEPFDHTVGLRRLLPGPV